MSEKTNHEIVQNYHLYNIVRADKKLMKSRQIILHDDPNNIKRGQERIEKVEHPSLSHLELAVNANKVEKNRYAFKLISKDICQKPFFRFDASGSTHRNNCANIPLALQSITTPHFHYYDQSGCSMAYKTDELKLPEVLSEISKNINEGMRIFCIESNTFVEDGSIPKIITADDSQLIPFEAKKDPLENIDFN